jgi:hypothetical protein
MLDLDNTRKSEDDLLPVKQEFINLCDEFSEFSDYCAFFCESVSLQAFKDIPVDKICAQGVERFADSIKKKAQIFDVWLQRINTRL